MMAISPAVPVWAGAIPLAARALASHPQPSPVNGGPALHVGRTGGTLHGLSAAALPLLFHRRRGRARLALRAGQQWVKELVPEVLGIVRSVRAKGKPSPAEMGGPDLSSADAPKATPRKQPQEMPQIEVLFESPVTFRSIWKPDQHASLESYLQSIEQLKFGYDISRVEASYDKDHTRFTISTVTDLREFLSLKNPGALHIRIPEAADWPTGLARNLEALQGNAVAIGKKVMNKFMQWVSNVEIDKDKVRAEEEKLKSIVVCEEFRAFGEVNQYEEVDMTKWNELIHSLQKDDLPPKVIHGLQRASMMGRLTEICFDLDYKDGQLRSAYLVRLLTMKTGNGQLNAVIFHYQLRFVSVANEGVEVRLTPEQALAIERFVDKAALLKWKEKLQISDEDDVDVF